MKAPHHRGSYHRRSRALVAQANADPATQCWRCGRTLTEVRAAQPPGKRPAFWTAGHLVDGETEGTLLPECSPCNYAAGARLTNTRRGRTELTW